MAMFLKNRIVSIEDTKKLDKVRPSYPVTFETLLQTITQAFGDAAGAMGDLYGRSQVRIQCVWFW